MIVHFEGSAESLAPGDTFVVNPGVPHCCTFGANRQPSRGLALVVDSQLLTALCFELCHRPLNQSALPIFHQKLQESELLSSAEKIVAEFSRQQRGFHLIIELLARQMLIHVLRAWPSNSITQTQKSISPQLPWLYMHRATEFMNTYGKGSFRLSALCQEVGLSSSRFIPLFRNSACMSPHSYYNHLLVFKAQRLLHNQECSTKEAAYQLGFKNASHFCALYHKLTGASPQGESMPDPAYLSKMRGCLVLTGAHPCST